MKHTKLSAKIAGVFLLVFGIVALTVFIADKLRKPAKPQIKYIPEEVVVEKIIQSETVAITEEDIRLLLADALQGSLEDVEEHLNELGMDVAAINRTSTVGTGTTTIIERIEGCEPLEPIEEPLQTEFAANDQEVTVPLGQVTLDTDGRLTAETFDLSLDLFNVITEDDIGTLSVVSRLDLMSDGTTYQIPITGETKYVLQPQEVVPPRRMDWWDPTFELGFNWGYNLGSDSMILNPMVGISLATLYRYGQPQWRFIQPGFSYGSDRNWSVGLAPFRYNLGYDLPIVDDLWIGPSLGLVDGTDPAITITIGTTL